MEWDQFVPSQFKSVVVFTVFQFLSIFQSFEIDLKSNHKDCNQQSSDSSSDSDSGNIFPLQILCIVNFCHISVLLFFLSFFVRQPTCFTVRSACFCDESSH